MEKENGHVEPVQLVIRDLHANVEGKEILRGVNLTVTQGETHALMGPNGSGKSTLANVVMGHPKYEVTQGEILFNGINILDLSPDKRARMGIFLAFSIPPPCRGSASAISCGARWKPNARATIPTRLPSRPARCPSARAFRLLSSARCSTRRCAC